MVVHVERDEVERPFVAQLEAMGWTHVPGAELDTLDAAVPLRRADLDELGRRLWMGDIR